MAGSLIDWNALKHESGDIPWPAIEAAIAQIAAQPAGWRELADVLHDDFCAEPHGFLGLYLPIILSEAARTMPADRAERAQIADFFLDELNEAEVRDDEFTLEVLQYASGRLGPSILPQVLERLETPGGRGSFHLWGLLNLAAKADDAALRERVARKCLAKVEAQLTGREKLDVLIEPLWTLGKLRYTSALERLKQLGRDHREALEQAHLKADFRETIRLLRGDRVEESPEFWERELHGYLEREQRHWREWYEQRDQEEEGKPAPEIDEQLAETQSRELAARFAQSSHAVTLARPSQEIENDVAMIVNYGFQYLDYPIEEWQKAAWGELLLKHLPAKVSSEPEWWKKVAPLMGAFLRWLGDEGISAHGPRLASEVESWGPDIESNAANPDHWGMAKSLVMEAKSEGVDTSNQAQLNAFIHRHNARLEKDEEAFADEDEAQTDQRPWEQSQTYMRESPKVGRNDPCPCGSGTKYKKCCGK